jgi:AhpC/TSA antioxidant enzyme
LDELDRLGVNLVMVSIGMPEKGKQLVEHLEIPRGQDYLFVDPENALYDDLLLNKGIKETFFSPGTPFAFLDRFTKRDGMKELTEVLSKWNKGKTG